MALKNLDAFEQLHSKMASTYDVFNKLALPVRLMNRVWTQERQNTRVVNFRVLNVYDQSWIFEGHLRWDAHGHPKPEVYGTGWTSFKRTMRLKVGDELVFYRPPNGPVPANDEDAPVFIIGVKRQVKFGGEIFSGHVSPQA